MRQRKVGIIGVGLIGGAIACRLKYSGFASTVIGIGRNATRLRNAKDLGIIDEFSTDVCAAIDCDLVGICVPVGYIVDYLEKVFRVVKKNCIVFDVGSVKQPIVSFAKKMFSLHNGRFVPTHPIAGSHLSGFEYASKDLFMGKKSVICIYDGIDEEALAEVKTMYAFLGMDTVDLPAAEHDMILAASSHLPHILSYCYKDVVGTPLVWAGAFRDFTRISYADTSLWNDIFYMNKDNLIYWIQKFSARLAQMTEDLNQFGKIHISCGQQKLSNSITGVAIDGPAGSGKSTLAKGLAERLGFRLIDTGAMYRAYTLACIRKDINLEDVDAIISAIEKTKVELSDCLPLRVFLDGEDVSQQIRLPYVTKNVVFLASQRKVREKMVQMQRELALEGNCVIEGRDVTTVVFPEARFKFYLDASFNERVNRRKRELEMKGITIDKDKLKGDMLSRDKSDLVRDVGPLRMGEDAIYLDSTNFSAEDILNIVYWMIRWKLS